jgi:tRNA A-37 threonylcarbamoyl transferase component Bud32
MADAKTCPTCGAPLAADAPGGACPKCLLAAGFATGSGGVPGAAARVPTPEELAPHFPGLLIERVLGRGGMGVVYKARHKALDRDVALKVLPAAVADDPAFAERFQREARALAKLQHPNIVLVHDFGQTDGLYWLVMEYVDGTNIRQAMKAGAVGPKEALAIVPQICDALQYAHEHGVVHRDIKPENVLLDRTGRVKVADFGLAKLMQQDVADLSLTGAGQVMGTPHYMAPEQWERPKDVDHRADIYSLGVVFYEMLTGELPVGRFAAPSKRSDVDARIDEIVLKTLEREREARYQRADEVKTAVGRATSADAPPPPQAPEPAAKVHGRWHWDSAEEKARGGRLSRMAVLGALGVPLAILAWAMFYFGAPLDPLRAERAGLIAGLMFLVTWILSIAAWARIHHQRGVLRGTIWAVIGTFLPLVACCAGGPFVLFVSTSVKPPEAPAPQPDGRTSLLSPIDTREQLKDLWEALQREHPNVSSSANFTDAERFYDRASWARIGALAPSERDERTRSGEIGLPLAAAEFLGEPLLDFHGMSIAVDEEMRTATLTVTSDRRVLTATAQHAERGWRFTDDPVQARDVAPRGAAGRRFALSSKLPEVVGATETPRIEALWNRLTADLARRDPSALRAFYLPSDAAALGAMSRDELTAALRGDRSQGGQLGLPYFASLDERVRRLAGFRLSEASVVDVVGGDDGARIVRVSAWAESATSRLHFHLRGRIIGVRGGPAIDWYFEKGHVNRLPR